ncbi:unnamed protein product [Bursaphelenchus okinawaensis]|uniref:Uncharacterized protein n=1 Tax=Bursaphelenchus okinawaensis TaxID=465554 RepID=A0A811JVP2_9BILA|nr:unnamed protein product [Bursaphelenchus okinawaensis]CAG9085127.1 unnamed protein product [Bursaphelenchus okinawaensis]
MLISIILILSCTTYHAVSLNINRIPFENFEIGRNIDQYSLYVRPNAVYVRRGDLSLEGKDVRIPTDIRSGDGYEGPAVIYIKFDKKTKQTAVWTFDGTVKRELLDGNLISNNEYIKFLPSSVSATLLIEQLREDSDSE